jgi:hypothetical protein
MFKKSEVSVREDSLKKVRFTFGGRSSGKVRLSGVKSVKKSENLRRSKNFSEDSLSRD